MQNLLSVSLIISTYNWSDALKVCLFSVLKQTRLPEEIIVADDGSTAETAKIIDSFRNKFYIPISHVWQEDLGFRLAAIRNKAIAKAKMEYIIQIDGDLYLDRNFVADHLNFAKLNSFVSGSRVMLGKSYSQEILDKAENSIPSVLHNDVSNRSNGFRLPVLSALSEKYRANDFLYIKGCNMAFFREDLIKVNGYDEQFIGWGREDNELAARLMNAGLEKRILKFAAIAYHLFHPVNRKDSMKEKDERLQLIINHKHIRTTDGIEKEF